MNILPSDYHCIIITVPQTTYPHTSSVYTDYDRHCATVLYMYPLAQDTGVYTCTGTWADIIRHEVFNYNNVIQCQLYQIVLHDGFLVRILMTTWAGVLLG